VPAVRAAAVPVTTSPRPTSTTTLPPPTTTTTVPAHEETGQASWYQAPAGTCASPNLAFGTHVTVTNLANGATTTCTVDDRQDPSTGRVLDLSEASFAQLADPSQGVIEVRLTW
jgi:rare lipoprotein A